MQRADSEPEPRCYRWRLGHDTGPTDNANGSMGGSILYSPFIRDRANLTLPHSPMADTPITSVTSHASLRHPESTFNQVMSLELSPVLRARRPDSSTEQSSGIEGDGLLQLERDLPARTAVTDTPSSLNDGADGHETESPAHAVEKIPACLKKTSRDQKANQRLGSEGVESKDTMEMNMPVATRTRRSTKLQHLSTAEKTKNITGKLQMETKENMKSILLQLRQQNQQQQDRLTEMNVMLTNVLEQQLSCNYWLFTSYART